MTAAWANYILGLPNFSNQIVDGVPGNGTVSDRTPPTHQVGGFYISVGMKMIRNWYLWVPEGRCNEAYTELGRVCEWGWS